VGAVRDPTAVIGRRVLAWLVDSLIVTAIFVSLFAVGAVRYHNEAEVADPCGALERAGIDAANCIYVNSNAYVTSASEGTRASLIGWSYVVVVFVVLQGLTGATPGKLLTGLRVVDERGARPGLGRATGRTVMWAVDAAPWIFPLVGFVTGLTTVGHRRVGDMVAKTYVVGRRDVGTPVVLPAAVAPETAGTAAAIELQRDEEGQAGSGPVWDERWATWVVWDEPRERWLRWDAARSRWVPMS
jgi:uncharacterized RDD family membrane protein YckC